MNWTINRPERRRLKVGASVAAQVLCVGWIWLMVNGWMFFYAWPIDLTEDERFTLPPETIALLADLDTKVEVVMPFEFEGSLLGILQRKVFRRATRVLEAMERQSGGNFRVVEQLRVGPEPEEWERIRQKYEIDEINRIYLITSERREVVSPEDLAVFRSADEFAPGEHSQLIAENVTEGLTVALKRVLRPDRPKVLFSQGHGEMPLEWMAEFVEDLSERGFETGSIDLREEREIPEETRVLITVCQGQAGFEGLSANGRAAIETFMQSGGRLFLLLPVAGSTGLEGALAERGIGVLPGVVVNLARDARGLTRENWQIAVANFDAKHPISRSFVTGEDRALFAGVRALSAEGGATTLLTSSPECWLETGRTFRRDAGDPPGPFPVAVASERGAERLVVFGTAFATRDQNYTGVARQLLLNSVFWLTNQEILSSGALASEKTRRIELDERTRAAFFWTTIVVMPGCSILAGLFAFWIRRRS